MKKVILTGLRTNAEYHLGNYLGGILPILELQKKHLGGYQVNMFAPDLHSFTTEIEHGSLYDQTIMNLKVFIASGLPIENEDFYLYRQSYVAAHSELAIILNNFAYFGELSRMTQFKDKNAQIDNVTVGLFDYPVLMASDILLYHASYIPVGADQQQHIEFTRDIALRFNNKFGTIFTIPESWEKQLAFCQLREGVRIRSLKDPQKKMSKSVEDPAGTIKLTDTPTEAAKKIKLATTDSIGSIHWDWKNQPGVTNLLRIYQLLSGSTRDEVVTKWRGETNYGLLKQATAEAVSNFLEDFQTKLSKISNEELLVKLTTSEKAMNSVASKTLELVQAAVGLR